MITKNERYSDLLNREYRLGDIFSNWPGMFLLMDKKGEILFSSDAMNERIGYKGTNLSGKNIWQMIHDKNQDEEYFQNALEECVEGKEVDFSTAFEGPAEKIIWLDFRIELFSLVKAPELIICVANDITRQLNAENELIESKASINAILEVAENERIQLGRELHDGLGQMLSAVSLMAHNLKRKIKDKNLPCEEDLEEIIAMLRETDEATRNLAHGMAHIELEKEGLNFALKRICERYQTLTNTDCEFTCNENVTVEDQLTALHLFRIAQEAARNAIKHGKATWIEIKLENVDPFLRLTVSDNGRGITAEDLNNVKVGMGISTMRYRAGILGGSLEIGDTPEGITRLVCLVPK